MKKIYIVGAGIVGMISRKLKNLIYFSEIKILKVYRLPFKSLRTFKIKIQKLLLSPKK